MKKIPWQKITAVLFVILAFAWVTLFFSATGILVKSEEVEGTLVDTLECTYFTGTGFVTKKVLKTDIDALGNLVCERLTDLE